MKAISALIKLAVIVAIAGFSMMNMAGVEITYFPGKPSISLPLFVVVLASIAVGAVLVTLIYAADRVRLGSQIRALRKQLKNSESDIVKLKNLPLTMNDEIGGISSKHESAKKPADALVE